MDDAARVIRYTWPYRSAGVVIFALSLAFPALMRWNHERIDGAMIAAFIAVAFFGIACFVVYTRWRVIVSNDGVEVRAPLSERRFAWSDVVAVQVLEKIVRFVLSNQSHVDVPVSIPGIRALFEVAGAHLPQTAWRS